MRERGEARRAQREIVAAEFGGTGGAQPLSQPGNHNLVGLVGERTLGDRRVMGDGNGDRVALHRIHRQLDAERFEQQRRVAAAGEHIAIGSEIAVVSDDAGNAIAIGDQPGHVGGGEKFHTLPLRARRQLFGEKPAVAGLVARKQHSTGNFFLRIPERRFVRDAGGAVEESTGNPETIEQLRLAGRRRKIACVAIQNQQAVRALVVGQAGCVAQFGQARVAVTREPELTFLVGEIARVRAIAQHPAEP